MRALERERQARLAAEEANRLKDETMAVVSHELRSALNGIIGWSELLLAGDLPAHETQVAAGAIHRDAVRQARLLDNLLEESNATFGDADLQPAPVDIGALTASVVEAMLPAASAAGIRVEVTTTGAAWVIGDSGRLHQVLANLVDNAVKFVEPGGSIHVEVSPGPGAVTIQVRDSGVGIDPEFLPFVFERFRRGPGATFRARRGLGLGLAIARDIVARHGGSIAAESRGPGSGATFSVSLPATSAEAPSPGAPVDVQPVMAPGRRLVHGQSRVDLLRAVHAAPRRSDLPPVVLVVDNDPDTLMLFERVLTDAGFWVGSAREGVDACEYARALQPDAIIMDLSLAGAMDGADLIRLVRSDPALRSVPVLGVTGHSKIEATDWQVSEILLKPVSPRALVSSLNTLLDRAGK